MHVFVWEHIVSLYYKTTVSATDFIFVEICDFIEQGWNFSKTYLHPC